MTPHLCFFFLPTNISNYKAQKLGKESRVLVQGAHKSQVEMLDCLNSHCQLFWSDRFNWMGCSLDTTSEQLCVSVCVSACVCVCVKFRRARSSTVIVLLIPQILSALEPLWVMTILIHFQRAFGFTLQPTDQTRECPFSESKSEKLNS